MLSNPKIKPKEVRKILDSKGIRSTIYGHVTVLGIRGYFQDSMGLPNRNDRGIYDDAFCVALHDRVVNFNGNTDPSAYRPGIAVLKKGTWNFIAGKHHLSEPPPRGYAAFRQYGAFTVIRDGQGEDRGEFGINFHRGGENGTSSQGCQTVPPEQWVAFRELIYGALGTSVNEVMAHPSGVSNKIFSYVLIDKAEMDAILSESPTLAASATR